MASYSGKPRKKPQVETTDEHCFLACSAWFLQFAILAVLSCTGTTYPREAMLTVAWALPDQSTIKKMPPTDMSKTNLKEEILQTRFPPPK